MRHLLLVLSLAACSGSGSTDTGVDAGDPGGDDSNDPIDEECDAGEHLCDDTCTPQLPNEVENGCALGCNSACSPPQFAVAVCSAEGTCDFACEAPAERRGDQCVVPSCFDADVQCGEITVGGMTQVCGACGPAGTCAAYQCSVPPDAKEPNNDAATATALASVDSDSLLQTLPDMSLATGGDEDWYTFSFVDLGEEPNTPAVRVSLLQDGQSSLGDYSQPLDMTVWFDCLGEDIGTEIICSASSNSEVFLEPDDPVLGVGCTARDKNPNLRIKPKCSGGDAGRVHVRVRLPPVSFAPRGQTYDLRWGYTSIITF